ncbi:MAG: peptidoglycan DD-metalloendopeptidase family protein [Parcubacteria group bacterium]|nr:peptidoglycan DD-metalloendopeptidase family protein [Parcubacteria group bacterium]
MFAKHNQIIFCLVLLFATPLFLVHAQIVDELQSKIEDRNAKIQEIQAEIDKLDSQIESVGNEAQTLESAIKQLELTDKKLTADIRLTEQRIGKANATIAELALLIVDKEKRIKNGDAALGQSIRKINELESHSFIEIIFSEFGFAGFWNGVQGLQQFQNEVHEKVNTLQELKIDHEEAKAASEKEKRNLVAFNARLADQKEIVRQNKANQSALLKETKNRESDYKKILAEQLQKREALEEELREFEAQLRIEIDPTSLPKPGKGILRWPLNSIKITQYFGNTSFANQNPQVYNNRGHNGIDLRASVGTVVLSAANGTVMDVGNTDAVRGCYSYGKWVLIRHFNGLATLYAHLSLIKVVPGQEVSVGEIIGYSGKTGYATGPHLHFTVYASQGVRVERFVNSKNCKNVDIPIAPTEAYLNPLSYL